MEVLWRRDTDLVAHPAHRQTPPRAPPPPPPVTPPIPPPPSSVPVPPPPAPVPSQEVTKIKPPEEEKPEAPPPKAEGKREAPPPPAPKTVAPSTVGPRYTLQVGAMLQHGHATDLQKRLKRLGYSARIRKAVSPKTRYMVYIGEVSSIHEAEATVQKLQREGFPARVISTQGGFLAGVGDFFALDEAIDLAHELQKKRYTPKIVDHQVLTTFHRVLVGSFDNRADALKLGRELKAQGFDNFVVKD
ncbi:MAG: SPOR domain-containing protein [Nitrososphaerota archaeon]